MMAPSVRWIVEGWWLEISHSGELTWDEMQAIKDGWFGTDTTCVEVYPASRDLVNNGNYRHLWRFPNMAEMVG